MFRVYGYHRQHKHPAKRLFDPLEAIPNTKNQNTQRTKHEAAEKIPPRSAPPQRPRAAGEDADTVTTADRMPPLICWYQSEPAPMPIDSTAGAATAPTAADKINRGAGEQLIPPPPALLP